MGEIAEIESEMGPPVERTMMKRAATERVVVAEAMKATLSQGKLIL
jgi:hypothetical protein